MSVSDINKYCFIIDKILYFFITLLFYFNILHWCDIINNYGRFSY
jgi:hypothetical protein